MTWNQTTTSVYSSKASGAVRSTAWGKRLAGSSRPRNCLLFSKVHSMAQRQA